MSDTTIDRVRTTVPAVVPTAAVIHEFITSRYPMVEITDQEDIFALGFINSLFAMELVMFLEKEFGFTIPTAELQRDNFATVAAMVALVERHRI